MSNREVMHPPSFLLEERNWATHAMNDGREGTKWRKGLPLYFIVGAINIGHFWRVILWDVVNATLKFINPCNLIG